MTEKYYTPSIDEFHVGFEYETYVPNKDVWSKEVFYMNESHIKLLNGIHLKLPTIRVKHLDGDDIRSLGFNCAWAEAYETIYEHDRIRSWVLTHTGFEYNIQINKGDAVYFRGTIRNKSELVKLLKQLNIL